MNENISYYQIIVETIATFFALLVLTRFLGKKQLSHLTFFNYVTGITIGSIASNMVIINTTEYLKELTSLIVWCLLTTLIGYISLKSGKMRLILDGQPTIVVKRGVIDKKALSRTKVNIDDLTMMIRQKEVFSIMEIEYAILEPNGAISILKKPPFQNTQKSDIHVAMPSLPYVPTEIITDGKIIKRNLKELGLSKEWLDNQLKVVGVKSPQDVFYAEIQSNGQLYIQRT